MNGRDIMKTEQLYGNKNIWWANPFWWHIMRPIVLKLLELDWPRYKKEVLKC